MFCPFEEGKLACTTTKECTTEYKFEKKHRVESGLTLLVHTSLPINFRWESFHTADYLTSRVSGRVLQSLRPFEKIDKVKPDSNFIKTFACACFSHLRPYDKNMLH